MQTTTFSHAYLCGIKLLLHLPLFVTVPSFNPSEFRRRRECTLAVGTFLSYKAQLFDFHWGINILPFVALIAKTGGDVHGAVFLLNTYLFFWLSDGVFIYLFLGLRASPGLERYLLTTWKRRI